MIQIDGRGFIKGTNQQLKEMVVVLEPISIKGLIVPPGEVIELIGGELIDAKNRKLVRKYDPAIDDKKETDSLETIIIPDKPKKLGPKRKSSKTLRQAQGDKEE